MSQPLGVRRHMWWYSGYPHSVSPAWFAPVRRRNSFGVRNMSAYKNRDDSPTAGEMASRGASKELEGYSSAFAVRDRLREQEEKAERSRVELREQRRRANANE